MAKVVVAGTRTFADYALLCAKLDALLANLDSVTIISGGASGADGLGERYAAERGYPVEVMAADWATHGRAAGPIRNEAMADAATHVVVFWDGKSRGSKSMMEAARRRGLPLRVIRYRHTADYPIHVEDFAGMG
jgi:hypothetical protein